MARKTISQRIGLEGGEKIKDDLQALGVAGEKAFKQIQDAADIKGGIGATFGKSIANLRAEFGKLRAPMAQLRNDLAGLGAAFGTVAARVGIAGVAVAGAVAGTVALAKSAGDTVDAAGKQAQALGLPIEAYTKLTYAAEMAGVSQEELGGAVKRLSANIADAANGNKAASAQFAALGVSILDVNGKLRPTEAILLDVADRLAVMPDGARKTALSMDLMGKSAANLLPLFNEGSVGIRQLFADAERLGLVFTKEQAAIGDALGDALDNLSKARQGISVQLGLLFAPAITEAANALTELIIRNRDAILDLGNRALAVVVPLVQDFINALTGNDAAVRSRWILDARDAVISFGQAVSAAVTGIIIPAFEALVAAADVVSVAVNSIFGTAFSGQELLIAAFVAKAVGLFGVLAATIPVVTSAVALLGAAVSATVGGIAALVPLVAPLVAGIATGLGAIATAVAGFLGLPALIVAGVAAAIATLGALVYAYWDEIKAGFAAAGEFIASMAAEFGQWIADGFRAGVDEAVASLALIADGAAAAWNSLVEIFGNVGVWLADRFAEGINLINQGWSYLIDGAQGAITWLFDGFTGLWDSIIDGFDWVGNAADRLWSRIKSIAASIKSALASAVSSSEGAGVSSDPMGFAGGGRIRGPGTGTSDSILARLSNGEYVIRAAAVKHYGPQLLDALNRMRLPKFNAGGMVAGVSAALSPGRLMQPIPAFADGGPVRGGRPMTLNIGGESFEGLTAPEDVLDRLGRMATKRHLASAGRKPGWVK